MSLFVLQEGKMIERRVNISQKEIPVRPVGIFNWNPVRILPDLRTTFKWYQLNGIFNWNQMTFNGNQLIV